MFRNKDHAILNADIQLRKPSFSSKILSKSDFSVTIDPLIETLIHLHFL